MHEERLSVKLVYLVPGLHSVQILAAVHFLQFSWHRLQMLEAGRNKHRKLLVHGEPMSTLAFTEKRWEKAEQS